MKFTFFALFFLYTLSGFAANVDTLIVKSVAQADSLRSIKQADKALNLLLRVRQDRAFGSASCVSRSLLFHKIGVCNYMLDNYRTALSYWRDTALVIRLKCLGKNNKETANSYYAVAMAYRFLGDVKNESKNVREAINILEALPDKDVRALAYNYLQAGYLFLNLEDYSQALNYFEQAERSYKSLSDSGVEELKYLAEIKKLKGLAKGKQARGKEAIQDILAAIDIYKTLNESTLAQDLAHCYNNLSITYAEILDYPNAEKYGQMALKINRTLSEAIEVSHNYESLGRIKKRQGQYVQALNYFRQSLAIRRTARNQKLIANAYENIADVYTEQQDYPHALENYQFAVSYLAPGQKNRNNLPAIIEDQSIVDRPGLLRVLGLQAHCWSLKFAQNKDLTSLEKALAFYESYDTLHIQVRQQFKESGSKYWLMQTAMPVYEEAIATSLQLHRLSGKATYLEKAYLFSAKSKAAVLLEGLQDLEAKHNVIPAKVWEKEQGVREQYAQLEKQYFEMAESGNERLLDSLQNQLFGAREQYHKNTEALESKYPAYYQLKYALPSTESVEDLRKKLASDAIILEYFIGKKTIYIFKISKTGTQCFEVLKPEGFEKTCLDFRKLSDGSSVFSPGKYALIANVLFESLLSKPLNGLDAKIKRLIIIPDNRLLQLSFDVLPYRPITGVENDPPYLIKKFAVSISYSNQLIFGKMTRKSFRRKAETYLGFGLEYDDFTLEGFKALNIPGDSTLKKRSAGRLPNSDDEVADIAALLHGDAWINQRATKNAFKANAPNYRILHLAMHSIIDDNEPLNSALIFSREKGSEDFILRASEVYGLNLQADMAVLSACNTSDGELTPEGVRSMSRAFTYAGCPSLIGSLWYAYDAPSREILVSFYQYLKAGKSKDVALQLAKLDYLKNASPTYSLPEYWSNLMVIGDPGVLELNNRGMNWPIMLGGLVLVALLFVVYKKRSQPR